MSEESDLKAFINGYDEAVNFTDPDGYYDEEMESQGHEDCRAFVKAQMVDLRAALEGGRPWDYLGHDFWLTRNRHGAGYWDRGLGDLGDRLTEAAMAFGEVEVITEDEEDDDDE